MGSDTVEVWGVAFRESKEWMACVSGLLFTPGHVIGIWWFSFVGVV